jgi:acyl-coenzyme A thioesterase PaaI-like protein
VPAFKAFNMAMPGYEDWYEWSRSQPAPPEDVAFFDAQWTHRILRNEQFRPISTPSFIMREGHSANAFIAKTMKGEDGLSHWLTLMRKDFPTPVGPAIIATAETSARGTASQPLAACDFLILLHLGPDLDGFGGRTHGGALCTILDEVLSLCVEYCRQATTEDRSPLYTVELKTTFRGGVPSPSTVMIKTWLRAREGRKWFVSGQICDENDNVLTQGDGIWVSAKPERL